MKRIKALFVAAAMVGSWGTSAAPAGLSLCPQVVSASAVETVSISTARDLVIFAARVNRGEEELDAILTKDIDLSSVCDETVDWTPIGGIRSDMPYEESYRGVFDGQGFTISGLCITGNDDNMGLFGSLSGTIKNLTVEVNIDSPSSSLVGAVCGYNNGGSIINCISTGSIQGNYSVGGMCGENADGSMVDCVNEAMIQGYGSVGGICGKSIKSNGRITGCKNYAVVTANSSYGSGIGGICGDNSSPIEDAANFGEISGYNNVGGICGSGIEIYRCYNVASIHGLSRGEDEIPGPVTGESIGGIVGACPYSITSEKEPVVCSCYNTGTVSGANDVGGIAGNTACDGIVNSYNIGSVIGSEAGIGGVAGFNYGTISNCYYQSGCAKDGSGLAQRGIGNRTIGKATADDYLSVSPIESMSKLVDQLNQDVTDWIYDRKAGHPILISNPEETAPNPDAFKLGDVDGNGIVDARDASSVLIYCVETNLGFSDDEIGIINTPEQKKAADMSGDGMISPYDAILILDQYVRNMDCTEEQHPYAGDDTPVFIADQILVPVGQKVVSYSVSIKNNPGYEALGLPLKTPENIVPEKMNDQMIRPIITGEGCGGLTISACYNSEGHSICVGTMGNGVDCTKDGAVFAVQLVLPDDAAVGDVYPITIPRVEMYNAGGRSYSCATVDGWIKIVEAETTETSSSILSEETTTATTCTTTTSTTTEQTTTAETATGTTMEQTTSDETTTTTDNCEFDYEVIEKDNVKSIRIKGLRDKTSPVSEVIIPAFINGLPVTSIGGNAFMSCQKLERIVFPDSVTDFGYYAFYTTPWLKAKQQEDPLVIVNNVLVDGLTAVGDVIIPEGVIGIGEGAFVGNLELTGIKLPNSLTFIGSAAFGGCDISTVTIPDNVTRIDDYTFTNCMSLTEIVLPKSVTFIGSSAFNGSQKLTIRGYSGSYAEEYAKSQKIPFIAIDQETQGSTEEPKTLIGDMDGNGELTISDAVILLRGICEMETDEAGEPIRFDPEKADYDGDGILTILDVTKLLTYLAEQGIQP